MGLAEWLTDPALRPILLPGLLAGAVVAVSSSLLSVGVVLKRLSFVGQGVSHSAFGGVGVAAALGLLAASGPGSGLAMAVVLLFCIIAALAMASIGDRRAVREDTAIGILLVASMSLGAVLLAAANRAGRAGGGASYEAVLFGQVLSVPAADAWLAAGASGASIMALWLFRRPLLMWAFDETGAAAAGVPTRAARLGLMVLLAVAIVTAMRLVGVILASALLVLPGATALRMARHLGTVLAAAVVAGLTGLVGGVAGALAFDWPAGATVVLAQTALFGLATAWSLRHRVGLRGGAA